LRTRRKKLAESRQAAQDLVAAKSAAVSSKEASCTQLQQEIDKLNDAYSRMQEGIKEKETSLENVKGQSAVLDERVKQSLDNSSRLEVRGAKLAQQITEWNTQLETLAGEYDKYEQGRQEAEVKVKDLTAAQSAKEEAVKTSEARVQELTESNFEDMRQLVELRNQIRSLETEQEQRMNRREALKNTAAGLEAKIAELQEQQREANDTKGSSGAGCQPVPEGWPGLKGSK
jgi:chromosome segregation protein